MRRARSQLLGAASPGDRPWPPRSRPAWEAVPSVSWAAPCSRSPPRAPPAPPAPRSPDPATSTGQHPNENYSRELMELFTMGGGNFSEDDVREGAKALAGWQLPQPDSIATVTVSNNVTRRLPVFST